MKKTIIITMIFAVIFALTACDNGNETHTHTYAATWSSDATQHWHDVPPMTARK